MPYVEVSLRMLFENYFTSRVTARHIGNVLCRKYSPRNFIRAAISPKVYLLKMLSRRPLLSCVKYLVGCRYFGKLYCFVVHHYYSLNSRIHRLGYTRHAELDFPPLEKLISRANMTYAKQSGNVLENLTVRDRGKSNIRFAI